MLLSPFDKTLPICKLDCITSLEVSKHDSTCAVCVPGDLYYPTQSSIPFDKDISAIFSLCDFLILWLQPPLSGATTSAMPAHQYHQIRNYPTRKKYVLPSNLRVPEDSARGSKQQPLLPPRRPMSEIDLFGTWISYQFNLTQV
jgi:hypothetical protein